MKTATGFFAALVLFFATDVHSAVVLEKNFPSSGSPGAHVVLSGQGFAVNSQIQVNGLSASIVQAQPNQIEFIIPADASSGFVAVEVNGNWFTNPVPFKVTRDIPGQLNPPVGVNRAGYRVAMNGEFISVNSSNGTFTAAVPVDAVDILWAFKTKNEPAFMAMIPPGTNQAILDAASTAEAFVLMNPLVNGRPLARYTNLVSALRALPEFTELTSLITSISGGGRDYLDDARFEDASRRAILALLQSSAGFAKKKKGGFANLFEPGQPNGTKLKYLNPPDGYFGYEDFVGLKTELVTPDSATPRQLSDCRSAARAILTFSKIHLAKGCRPIGLSKCFNLIPSNFPMVSTAWMH